MTAAQTGTPQTPDEPVGQILARMRKAKRLTGAELAAVDLFQGAATTDIAPVLGRHEERYIAMLRRPEASAARSGAL